ncbi:unnamed protein product [Phytophthora lilii]|uniref:Unnamed protein product n=1 Tax=Phytophthora lilii TaxID=2077276 RepID=A0A9W6TJC3_9STRA|nr:unnamed protein product [Phytophthora lilii]
MSEIQLSDQYLYQSSLKSVLRSSGVVLFPDAAQSVLCAPDIDLNGDGYSNNTAYSSSFATSAAAGGASITNDGFVKRLLSNPPTSNADFTTSWPSVGSAASSTTISNQTSRGAFVAGASGHIGIVMGTWNYMLKIKLTDLHPIFRELDLMANPQIRLRFRVNQGTAVITTDLLLRILSWGAVVYSLEPTIDGTYMPFTTSPVYVPFVHLENSQAIISKPVKKVRYNDCYAQWFYQRAGIGKQSTQHNTSFDLQLSALVKNAKYVTFDISHDYDFHHFTNEVAKIGAINGDLTPELVNGLLDYQTWSLTNRVLIADVSRLTKKDVPQSIQIQGTNAGCQRVNMLVLVISEQELSYDRLTGDVLDFTTA